MAARDTTVLLLGSGGREHAIAWKLAQSPRLKNLYAMPGSAAIAEWAQNLSGDPTDPRMVAKAAQDAHAKLVFIGPEAPLAAGVADALRQAGIACFGPGMDAARLESSKAFAKDFMKRHGLPTARYEAFDDLKKARAAAASWGPVVVKADGLAAGKGVWVCGSSAEAEAAIDELAAGRLGAAGSRVVLEDRLDGPEVSILGLLDGKDFALLPPSQDHKRLKDGDQGPNTGGMGAYAPIELSKGMLERVEKEVFSKALAGLRKDGLDYRGVLYAGLMLTKEGPKLLEFNCRFGDPETQAILPVLEEDLLELALACANGTLGKRALRAAKSACVGVTIASAGYPERSSPPEEITGLGATGPDTIVFHAGTRYEGGRWLAAGGRVLTVCGLGPDFAAARRRAYDAAQKIGFKGMQFRRDIGAKELVA